MGVSMGKFMVGDKVRVNNPSEPAAAGTLTVILIQYDYIEGTNEICAVNDAKTYGHRFSEEELELVRWEY